MSEETDKAREVLASNASAFLAANEYMKSAKPFAPARKATADQVLALLRSWSDSEFATAASGEFCEDLKGVIEGALSRVREEGRLAALDEAAGVARALSGPNIAAAIGALKDTQ